MGEHEGPGVGSTVSDSGATETDINELLSEAGFDADSSVLTRRQAEVLVMRERGHTQADIADLLGTSRANVASVEASARTNVDKARETVAFAEGLSAPVSLNVPAGTDLYDVPEQVFEVCDEVGVKVNHTAPDLMKVISDAAIDAVQGRRVRKPLRITVTEGGTVRVRTP